LHRTARVTALLWLGALVVTSPAAAETRPPVVELFTSQGCSSCPPADALLGELARRGDVIALGFHIDYWDKLGWKDPLSTPQSTERQRRYARLFGTPTYTPQLVIDGTREMVGSQRETVLAALRQTTPAAVAAWDSLGQLDLVTALEQEFSVEFGVEEIMLMNSVGQIRSVLERRNGAHG